MGAAVLRPAGLGVLGAGRPLFAVADDRDTGRRHAVRDEVVHRGLGAPLAQRHVVLVGAALVAVALDQEQPVTVRLQPRRIGVEDPGVAGADLVLVEVEVHVLELGRGDEVARGRPGGRRRRHCRLTVRPGSIAAARARGRRARRRGGGAAGGRRRRRHRRRGLLGAAHCEQHRHRDREPQSLSDHHVSFLGLFRARARGGCRVSRLKEETRSGPSVVSSATE